MNQTEQTRLSGCFSRLGSTYSITAILLLNTLILLIVIEGAAALILRFSPQTTLEQEIAAFKEKMLGLSYYQAEGWSAHYWDEHFQIVDNWSYVPYALWRTRPFSGVLINVDENGIRKTHQSDCQPDSYRIFTFGGSTMWGYGVPDNFTIASYLQENMNPRPVCVVNYGEVGYNATQGLITLIRLIEKGDIPDMVLFYDGTNEVTIANRTGEAGGHFYLENIQPVLKGEIVQSYLESSGDAVQTLLRNTSVYRLIAGKPIAPQPSWKQPPFEPLFLDQVTNTYLTSIQVAADLAETHGFRFYAFLQPVLPMVNRDYHEGEEQMFIWQTPGGLVDLFKEVYPRWQAASDSLPYLIDLSNILDTTDLAVWIDFNHLSAWGNLMVAHDISNIIRPVIDEDLASHSG